MHQIAGTHLTVDAYVAMVDVLSTEHILRTFDKLLSELRMEKLGEPVVREVPVRLELLSTDEDEGGVSIIMPITTSHVAIHVWPERLALMLDVFSCHPFDADAALKILTEEFKFTSVSTHVIDRKDPMLPRAVGVEYPVMEAPKVDRLFPWSCSPR